MLQNVVLVIRGDFCLKRTKAEVLHTMIYGSKNNLLTPTCLNTTTCIIEIETNIKKIVHFMQ